MGRAAIPTLAPSNMAGAAAAEVAQEAVPAATACLPGRGRRATADTAESRGRRVEHRALRSAPPPPFPRRVARAAEAAEAAEPEAALEGVMMDAPVKQCMEEADAGGVRSAPLPRVAQEGRALMGMCRLPGFTG